MTDYQRELFEAYADHASALDRDERAKEAWFVAYAARNYSRYLQPVADRNGSVLDVGCSGGFLLAALRQAGHRHLFGVDLSPADVASARRRVPEAQLECADAADFLDRHQGEFDAIVMKAVLEHVLKSEVLDLLRAVERGLRPGGVAIVDVPNMDWLFASHERYMDFTHEGGFTRDSLAQTMGRVFGGVVVTPVDNLAGSRGIRTRVARSILGLLLRAADPEGGSNPIWARSIVGVGRRESS